MTLDPLTPDVGVFLIGKDSACWRVWAPKAEKMDLVIDPNGTRHQIAMEGEGHGYFAALSAVPKNGLRYAYSIDGGLLLPDPASRWQPDGINEASAVFFPNRLWEEGNWAGRERRDLVFYELHVGTFTTEGTFEAVIPRIDTLLDLGITAIELMPITQFPGIRSWGYDGVHPLAVQHSYGGPEALQKLVEVCHQKGMAVVLDVVFNHFGPEGEVLTRFGDYLTDRYKTGWGLALNYDGRGCDSVRSLAIQAVRQWVRDYHVDGFRLDAADQIFDQGPRHILSELAEAAHEEAARLGRPVHVFAETDLNDAPRFLHPNAQGGYGFDGHWNDDFHHALHVVLTGETNGYYSDFSDGPHALAKVLTEGFANNGNYSEFRGRRHGTSANEFSGDRFVAFSQNHDQVGNRLRSDRYAASLPPSAVRLAAGVLLLAPRLPLLFMGQEYGETNPFPFFCDFRQPDLIEAVRRGRKAEFASFGWQDEMPDPFAGSTRDSAVLSWSWPDPVRSGLRCLYRDLLRLRRESPALRDFSHTPTQILDGTLLLEMTRGAATTTNSPVFRILFNLGDQPCSLPSSYAGLIASFRSEVAAYGSNGPEMADMVHAHEFLIYVV